MKHIALVTTLCSSLVLTACGGSSSSSDSDTSNTAIAPDSTQSQSSSPANNTSDTTQNTQSGTSAGGSATGTTTETTPTSNVSISGKVADGYLVGAKVCLDKNLNDKCDPDEPSAISTAGGDFELQAEEGDDGKYPIVAEVTETTIDEDTGEAVGEEYVLSSPPVKNKEKPFVSPVSHMVRHTMKQDSTLDIEEAKDIVAEKLGIPADEIDGDFIERAQKDTDADKKDRAKELHNQARKLARAMAEATKKTKELTANLPDDERDEVVSLVMETIETILPKILNTQVVESEGNVDFSKLDQSIGAVIQENADLPEDLESLKEAIDHQKDKQQSESISLKDLLAEGLYMSHMGGDLTEAVCGENDKCMKPASIDIEEIVLDAVTQAIQLKSHTFSIADLALTTNEEEQDEPHQYLLNEKGEWVTENDRNCELKESGEKESLVHCQSGLHQFKVSTHVIDISNRTISQVVQNEFMPLKVDEGVFPEGSKLVHMKTKQTNRMVMLPIFNHSQRCNDDTVADFAGNCNIIMAASDETMASTQLDEVLSKGDQPAFNVQLPDGVSLSLIDDNSILINANFGSYPMVQNGTEEAATTASNTNELKGKDAEDDKIVQIENERIKHLIEQMQHQAEDLLNTKALKIGEWKRVQLEGNDAIKISLKHRYMHGLNESYDTRLDDLYLVIHDGFVRTAFAQNGGRMEVNHGLNLNKKAFDALTASIKDSIGFMQPMIPEILVGEEGNGTEEHSDEENNVTETIEQGLESLIKDLDEKNLVLSTMTE